MPGAAAVIAEACSGATPPLRFGGLRLRPGGAPQILLVGDSARVSVDGTAAHVRATWASSDTTVAAVDATGLVRGLRFGEARITAAVDGTSISVLIIVTPPVLVGAGDIASCGSRGDEETAAILDSIPGIVFTAGDNVYGRGTAAEFARCYGPSWGRHRWRTRPSPGNHDYKTRRARPYFDYFGPSAGPRGRGYYSYELGSWHVVVLNAMLDLSRESPQYNWLERDLARQRGRRVCTVAIMHSPRFSSGPHGGSTWVHQAWRLLYAHGAEVVISGHDHLYERFAPQTPKGVLDVTRGVRQFVAGMGGRDHYRVKRVAPNSEVRIDDRFGVLKLTLGRDGYQWAFITAPRGEMADSGKGRCH